MPCYTEHCFSVSQIPNRLCPPLKHLFVNRRDSLSINQTQQQQLRMKSATNGLFYSTKNIRRSLLFSRAYECGSFVFITLFAFIITQFRWCTSLAH